MSPTSSLANMRTLSTRMEIVSPRQQQLGRYLLVETLGQGGMGTVYLALASGLGQFKKLLVVKELRQDLTRQKGFVTMFMDEAKLAARLAHPNVVQTFEASQEGERYYLAMEYLDGQSLSALLDRMSQPQTEGKTRPSKLPLWVHIQILREVLSGLHYAHELRDYDGSSLHVVHRDVSPQNVFVTYDGQVKVVDFGVAKAAGAGTRTAPGVFIGKFAYASPEQLMGRPVDARTDVFSVGVMLWQAIAGRALSIDPTPTPAAFRARSEGTEPRIEEVVPTVDPLLAQICNRALALEPDKRFATAQEFRSALQEYLQTAGARVESSEIGQLMRDVFEAERRAMHQRIEQVMKHSGGEVHSSIEALSFFHPEDKESTAVADLSSLVDVSLERDDQKIRQGYARSKVTVRPPSDNTLLRLAFSSRRRSLVTFLALPVLCGLPFLLSQFEEDESSTIVAKPVAPLEVPVSPSPAPTEPVTGPEPAAAPSDAPALYDDAPAATPAPPATPVETRSATITVNVPHRSSAATAPRPRVGPARAEVPARAAPETAPARSSDAPAPAQQRAAAVGVEEGIDLHTVKRGAGSRIDIDNPYQQ